MKTVDATKHFGTQTELARLLGTRQSTVASWGEFPPPLRQLQIQALSGGLLKAEGQILPRKAKYRLSDAVTQDGISNSMEKNT